MIRRSLLAAGLLLGWLAPACAGAAGAPTSTGVPYALGSPLPALVGSPPVARDAPFTPVVRRLLGRLLPGAHPDRRHIGNAIGLLDGIYFGADPACPALGRDPAPTGTRPSIAPLCWADAVGINVLHGRHVGQSTAPPEPLAIASSFDAPLNDVWGQVEGAEGRELMVTGLLGPEADLALAPDWERGLDTLGEDPFLAGILAAAQVDGMQGRGLMAQVKHLAAFSGAQEASLTQVDDRTLHELLLAPFESAVRGAGAASVMCGYNMLQDTSRGLPGAQPAVVFGSAADRRAGGRTWPLGEAHFACEQPLTLNYALRHLWGSTAFVGSDYPATHSTSSVAQGLAQEFPLPYFFGANPAARSPYTIGILNDPTGDTCAREGRRAPCGSPGAAPVGGIPGPGCPPNGCGLPSAVATGNLPVGLLRQQLAEVLYQEQRFGLLGCDQRPVALICTNPGGVRGVRSGAAGVPRGPASGARPVAALGTENGDAAVVERLAEEGAVLLKNRRTALPLTAPEIRRGVAVTGPGAEYLIAQPSNEAATGFPDRIAISPLRQLRALSGRPTSFTYTPAESPTGIVVPSGALSSTAGHLDGGLTRTSGPGAPRHDPTLDFTTASPAGTLTPGTYRWTGFLYVPQADSYTFRFQYNDAAAGSRVQFALDQAPRPITGAESIYCGQYYRRATCVPTRTMPQGVTQAGLFNARADAGQLSPGFHELTIDFRARPGHPASFRFGYSRAHGDIVDAADAARGRAAAIVFVNDDGIPIQRQESFTPPSLQMAGLPQSDVDLIDAVSAANPNTIVVMNTANPVIVRPWIDNPGVKAVLEMWNSGSEGGTATARLLLGQADPGGHTAITWPAGGADTPWAFPETRPLFPGDHPGVHPERLNGLPDANTADCDSSLPPPTPCTRTVLSQQLFSGYRFFEQEHLQPEFPFGFGLSYTRFGFSGLSVRRSGGGAQVTFTLRNTGSRDGADVAQVYVSQPAAAHEPPRTLQGFRRVLLRSGARARVTIALPARAFQHWDVAHQRWLTARGCAGVSVGDSSEALPLHGDVGPAGGCG